MYARGRNSGSIKMTELSTLTHLEWVARISRLHALWPSSRAIPKRPEQMWGRALRRGGGARSAEWRYIVYVMRKTSARFSTLPYCTAPCSRTYIIMNKHITSYLSCWSCGTIESHAWIRALWYSSTSVGTLWSSIVQCCTQWPVVMSAPPSLHAQAISPPMKNVHKMNSVAKTTIN